MTQRPMVFYFPGSPAERFLQNLRQECDCRSLPSSGSFEQPGLPPGVLLVEAEDELSRARATKCANPELEIVALGESNATGGERDDVYIRLPRDISGAILARIISNAFAHLSLRLGHERTATVLKEMALDQREMNEIGIKLSAERDTGTLLELILDKVREITGSDAGSLYLVEDDRDGARWLRFKLAQNDSMEVSFKEFTFPIGPQSLAGYVAMTGEVLNLANACELTPDSPFRINEDFDRQLGYHSKSMLVVPMTTPQGRIIGVCQLVNCRPDGRRKFSSPEEIEQDVVPFSTRHQDLAANLASQAAVALENSRLYQSMENLFESFVRASVTAIESRDPSTAGHSFRVAELTVGLALAIDRAQTGPFKQLRFTAQDIKELRYAAILHDFGNIGVRESVLVKAKKLYPEQLELIRQRAETIKQGIELRHARNKIQYLLEHGIPQYRSYVAAQDDEMRALIRELEEHLKLIITANEPAVGRQDFTEEIHKIALRGYQDQLNRSRNLLTVQEAAFLSSPSGSIDPEERTHIQSHVTHTYTYLSQIPWTRELRRVPDIAFRHHERIDGSGYPRGLRGKQIPLQSRIIMISNVFDALTACDRPYKSAVPIEDALDVLRKEKGSGTIEGDLVDLFIQERVYECVFAPNTT